MTCARKPCLPRLSDTTSAVLSFWTLVGQRRLACSVGDSPTGVEVRSLVTWIASVEETKRMKPIDQAILGMVSESPGRNESEPTGGLDKKITPEAELSSVGRRQYGLSRADRGGRTLRRGGRGSTVARTC